MNVQTGCQTERHQSSDGDNELQIPGNYSGYVIAARRDLVHADAPYGSANRWASLTLSKPLQYLPTEVLRRVD